MRKLLVKSFITLLLLIALAPSSVSAAPDIVGADPDNALNSLLSGVAGEAGYNPYDVNPTSLSQKVGRIVNIALSLVGTIFFALAVYAGFLWMTAAGNDEQVTKATDILKTALVGLIIALAAFSISVFVTSRLVGYTVAPAPAVGAPAPATPPTTGFWAGFGNAAKNYWNNLTN